MSDLSDYQDEPWLDPDAVPFIRIQSITKNFGDFTAVSSVDLDIYKGELFCLLGGSGCGKTTLLRMLAGFETPSSGMIYIDGMEMTEVPPYERPVNMMFQSYALFPHMDVEKNVAYGLKRDGVEAEEIRSRVADMLAMVELESFSKRKPHQLSGGQRQRVALARALIKRPKVLLLDEPLAALDKRLREQTQFELMNIQEKLGVTFVVVTHDQEEAMTLSTRIAVMDMGKFVQIGTPTEIYEYPETRMVANFIGSANMFEGRVTENSPDHITVHATEHDTEFYIDHGMSIKVGSKVWVAVRPEKIKLSKSKAAGATSNQLKGVVQEIGYLGNISTYRIKIPGGSVVEVTVPNQVRPKDGRHAVDWEDEVYLGWDASSPVVLTK
jgi:putrescine transport system ATP-binding protein